MEAELSATLPEEMVMFSKVALTARFVRMPTLWVSMDLLVGMLFLTGFLHASSW